MHIVPKVCRAVTLFGCDGSVRRFASLRQALSALGYSWIRENVARHFREFDPLATLRAQSRGRVYREARFVMRDDFGEPLVAHDFEHLLPPWPAYRRRRSRKWHGWVRQPPTFRVLREALGWHEEGEPDDRPRRRLIHGRCVCCLSSRASTGEVNWKRHTRRPRQWKPLRE